MKSSFLNYGVLSMKEANQTTEFMKKDFDNTFDLVLQAIDIARDIVNVGQTPKVPVRTDNPAYLAIQLLDNQSHTQIKSSLEQAALAKAAKEEAMSQSDIK